MIAYIFIQNIIRVIMTITNFWVWWWSLQ